MGLLKADLQQLGRSENFQGNDDEPGRNLFADLHLALMFYILARNCKFNSAKPLLFAFFCMLLMFPFAKWAKFRRNLLQMNQICLFFLTRRVFFEYLKSGKATLSSNSLYSQTPDSTHQKGQLCHLKSKAFFCNAQAKKIKSLL